VQFPIVLGGIVPVINLPGYAAGELRLSGPVLADIFLGDVTRWNDPALRALNPERVLPDMPIVVVHRQDGSGTTQTFTEFLSAESVPFRTRVGSDTLVRWPVGRAAEGGGGVERLTRATVGAIGYLEFGQMRRSGLADAAVRNGTGAYARPSVASMHAAAAAVRFDPAEGFRASMIGAPGQNVYPITAATYVLVPHMARSTARTRRTLHFFRLALSEGAADALQLGYAPLPEELATAVLTNLRERFRQRLTF
jgi:phosphate transport system substrate-binding protein